MSANTTWMVKVPRVTWEWREYSALTASDAAEMAHHDLFEQGTPMWVSLEVKHILEMEDDDGY